MALDYEVRLDSTTYGRKFSVDADEAFKILSAKRAVHEVQEIGLTKASALLGHLSQKYIAKDFVG